MQKYGFEMKISTQMYLETQGLHYPSKSSSSVHLDWKVRKISTFQSFFLSRDCFEIHIWTLSIYSTKLNFKTKPGMQK